MVPPQVSNAVPFLDEEEVEVVTGEGSADLFVPALQRSRVGFSAGSVGLR